MAQRPRATTAGEGRKRQRERKKKAKLGGETGVENQILIFQTATQQGENGEPAGSGDCKIYFLTEGEMEKGKERVGEPH